MEGAAEQKLAEDGPGKTRGSLWTDSLREQDIRTSEQNLRRLLISFRNFRKQLSARLSVLEMYEIHRVVLKKEVFPSSYLRIAR